MGGDPSAGMSQAQILKEQDRGLDSLHDIIVRQRAIAENIEAEVNSALLALYEKIIFHFQLTLCRYSRFVLDSRTWPLNEYRRKHGVFLVVI